MDYNPHTPRILGEEWVPIREEALTLLPQFNAEEHGYSFTNATSRIVSSGNFYLKDPPVTIAATQTYQIAVYPEGNEALSGPVRRVVIPCNFGGVTGAAALGTGQSVASALLNPADTFSVTWSPTLTPPTTGELSMFFNVNSYAQILNGKRILGVNFLYAGNGNWAGSGTIFGMFSDVSSIANFLYVPYGDGNFPIVADDTTLRRIRLGEMNPYGDTSSSSPLTTSLRLPWRGVDLGRFEASSANRLHLHIYAGENSASGPFGISFSLTYAALEVLFCEEQRIMLGAQGIGLGGTASSAHLTLGANPLPMRDITTQALNPTLPVGNYTVEFSVADVGQEFGGSASTSFPALNALRQLYPISSLRGLQVNLPAPPEDHVGDTFTKETLTIIPQLTLHTSGGVITETHPYGTQAVIPVYGSITAVQGVYDAGLSGSQTYQQARFYARRYGNTTVSLSFFQTTDATKIVSITPAAFDALDGPIIDNWKEVTLRFTTPPTFTGTSPTWTWSATGETAANRWEVLGCTAPALSGSAGNLLHLAPQQLGTATYEPPSGSTIDLIWQTPTISGTAADTTSDAMFIFSQDLPAVTGLAATILTQTLTGIGQHCGLNPDSIPTGMQYVRLSWSPTSSAVPVSGFGSYEIQRMDAVDSTWQTIMLCSSPTISGFSDFEARPGILSSYRIRANDVYDFANTWSSTVTTTLTAPGATIGRLGGGHLMLFSSNSDQSGALNLAYCSVWTGAVEEDFIFPEAGDVAFQQMYNRDFVVAFRPLERGGDRFSRTVLVQAAAIAPETLSDFTSLRDMAWADVPFICVRDEDGNRWFANVNVPNAKVQLNRSIYMASVDITEVSDTPTPVDPAS